MSHTSYRRLFGLLLGLMTGLAYGVVSQSVNFIALPDVPLFRPPFGPVGNTILSTILGGALGLASSWSETGAAGVIWGSLLGSLAMVLASLFTGKTDPAIWSRKLIAVAFIFVPAAAVLSPLLILFRWITGREEVLRREFASGLKIPQWQRVGLPVVMVLTAGVMGLFSLYPDLGRAVTPRMNLLIREGLQAVNTQSLPVPLQAPDVKAFADRANQAYTLQWDKDDQNKYAIPRPATSPFDQSIVIARFDSGYILVCMFPTPEGTPECRDF